MKIKNKKKLFLVSIDFAKTFGLRKIGTLMFLKKHRIYLNIIDVKVAGIITIECCRG